jgi:hypothetical protein
MLTAKQLEVAESVFDRNKRREAEINDALRQEQARHEAAVKNMQRLRALRLARDAKPNNRTQIITDNSAAARVTACSRLIVAPFSPRPKTQDLDQSLPDVRFAPESGHRSARWQCPLCATSRHPASQQNRAPHSISSLRG